MPMKKYAGQGWFILLITNIISNFISASNNNAVIYHIVGKIKKDRKFQVADIFTEQMRSHLQ